MTRILDESSGAIRTVTLNRPEKRNALDSQMLDELGAALAVPPAVPERVLVIRSTGTVFCAGLDLRERIGGASVGGASPIEGVLHAIPHSDVDALVDAARASADAREGIAARLEKRAPAFEGR